MPNKAAILCIVFLLFVFSACHKAKNDKDQPSVQIDLEQILKRDTLKVGIMYGPTSYFLYREEYMGFDYEMASHLATSLGVKLKITEAKSEIELEHLLQERKIDLAANNIIETKELKQLFSFVFPQEKSYQVLVQTINANLLSDVTELADKKVYVKPNTIQKQRLEALYRELGGSFEIVEAPDSLSAEDLIEMVAQNKISYTVASYKTAQLYKSFYKKLDLHLAIGFEQHNGWLVRRESERLKDAIEHWIKTDEHELLQANLANKYWTRSIYFAQRKVRIPKGAISPFDHFFKKYATEINWNWKLLAAVAFHESRFDSSQVSWAGASGIMQLMPRTAANFGLTRKTILNPEKNIEAGVQYIKSLNLSFRKIANKEERIKFILAAYNSGPAHVIDAMALAKKHGKNPHIWFNNVEYYLIKKSEPEFYNDPVVKNGRFRAKETVSYVNNTLETFHKYSGRH